MTESTRSRPSAAISGINPVECASSEDSVGLRRLSWRLVCRIWRCGKGVGRIHGPGLRARMRAPSEDDVARHHSALPTGSNVPTIPHCMPLLGAPANNAFLRSAKLPGGTTRYPSWSTCAPGLWLRTPGRDPFLQPQAGELQRPLQHHTITPAAGAPTQVAP
jgi:hypothetical protein